MADEPLRQPAPFNEDALRGLVQDSVRTALHDQAQRAQAQQVAQAQQQMAARAQTVAAQDPVYQHVVRPYVEPIARQMAVQSQGALDAVKFYNQHPAAVKYMDHLEANFNQLAAQGMPFDRATIWNHYRGQNFEHFQQQAREEATAAAARGATIGSAGVGRPDAQPFDLNAFKRLPLDEMEKALEGAKF